MSCKIHASFVIIEYNDTGTNRLKILLVVNPLMVEVYVLMCLTYRSWPLSA